MPRRMKCRNLARPYPCGALLLTGHDGNVKFASNSTAHAPLLSDYGETKRHEVGRPQKRDTRDDREGSHRHGSAGWLVHACEAVARESVIGDDSKHLRRAGRRWIPDAPAHIRGEVANR